MFIARFIREITYRKNDPHFITCNPSSMDKSDVYECDLILQDRPRANNIKLNYKTFVDGANKIRIFDYDINQLRKNYLKMFSECVFYL